VTDIRVSIVDVYVLRPSDRSYDVLCLKRAAGQRCAGTWETVHGHIVAGESPAAAARRELLEETGLTAQKLYNLSRVESFYMHKTDEIALIPVFAAIVPRAAVPKLSAEHDESAWLAPEGATRRFAWPREVRAMNDALALLKGGSAGGLEDVLLVD
jgi:dATP pyrophosphohydrolase